MGSASAFQRQIDSLSLTRHVRVRVFLASDDRIVSDHDPRLWRVLGRLQAEVVLVPRADHETVVAAAADWLRIHGSWPSAARP